MYQCSLDAIKEIDMGHAVLAVLKKMLLALLGEKLVAYVTFAFLEWLATQSKTKIDDKIVKEWKEVYYGGEVNRPREGG